MATPPVLWQYNVSNFNEKVRSALDYKAIAHVRRSLLPNMPRALLFSVRGTLPVLDLEDFFDEHPGHELRRAAFYEQRDNPDYVSALLATGRGTTRARRASRRRLDHRDVPPTPRRIDRDRRIASPGR